MSPPTETRALVVFSGKADLPWLRLLRPGFRHCFVLLRVGEAWICVNPLAHRTSIELWHPASEGDLVHWLRRQDGLTVVETVARIPPRTPAPLGLYSCVEEVKRVLGLHDRWTVTPRRLYLRLIDRNKYIDGGR